ncbi:MAG: PBP1A family penicillin-binding protein [Thermoanaerobaculia bacterium]
MKKFIFFAILFILAGVIAGYFLGRSFSLPQIEQLKNFKPPQTTILYDRYGKPYAFYGIEKRVLIKAEDIPFALKTAILSAEDKDFYKHSGISIKSLIRALMEDVKKGKFVQGGSTITQQLSKMLFLSREKTLKRKINEALLSFSLEKKYSKDEILAFYLNQVYLGNGNYGVGMASDFYFSKEPKDLSLDEAALLAGLIRTPEIDSPTKNPKRALERRNEILRRMYKNGFISKTKYEELIRRPLNLRLKSKSYGVGEYFSEEVRRYLYNKYGYEKLYREGLSVYTTIDLELQEIAEIALFDALEKIEKEKGFKKKEIENIKKQFPKLEDYEHPTWRYLNSIPIKKPLWGLVMDVREEGATVKIKDKKFELDKKGFEWTRVSDLKNLLKEGDLIRVKFDENMVLYLTVEPKVQGALVILENSTGKIRAIVGGTDFDKSEFNRATQAYRQAGSAFKPFTYAAAFEKGQTPADLIYDAPVSIYAGPNQPIYSPKNYYLEYYGIVTLREALEQSYNVSAVKLFETYKNDVIEMAKKCGIDREIPPFPSAGLGTIEVTPLDLISAYTTFANLGARIEPYFIEEIRQGNLPLEKNEPKITQVLSPQVAFLINYVMEGVIDRGTAAEAKDIPLPLAGKTGTTVEHTDAWFIGFSPTYTIGVWVGNDKKVPIGYKMTGARAALPAFMEVASYIAQKGLENSREFAVPKGINFVTIDRLTGKKATSECKETFEEAFIEGTEPESFCSEKWHKIKMLPYYMQKEFYIAREGEPMDFLKE